MGSLLRQGDFAVLDEDEADALLLLLGAACEEIQEVEPRLLAASAARE